MSQHAKEIAENSQFRLLTAPSKFVDGVVKFGNREVKVGGPLHH